MVLAYHKVVSEPSSYIYAITRNAFAAHLQVVSRVVAAVGDGQRAAQVTFDDGHISQYHYGLPLLEKFGVRATFFVTVGWTNVQPDYMTARQLQELISLGHDVQAHGWSHGMLPRCSPGELYDELVYSKKALEDLVGQSVRSMSMPHGRWNEAVLELCARAGYKRVYISNPQVNLTHRSGLCVIGRKMIIGDTSVPGLRSMLLQKRGHPAGSISNKIKRIVRSVIGDAAYHRVWRICGRQTERLPSASRPQRPTRILQLISSGGYYGAESMLVNLASSLSVENCQTLIGVFRNTHNPQLEIASRAKALGLEVEMLECRGPLDRRAMLSLRSLIIKQGIDIIHTHGCKANFYGAWAALAGVHLVATVHIDWPDRSLRLYFEHILDRLVLRRFTKIAAVSDAIQLSLRRFGLSCEKIKVIGNGVDLGTFTPESSPQRPESEVQANPVIGVVGRLTPQKGHAYLIRAAPRLLLKYPDIVFLFVGDGPELPKLRNLASSLAVENNVIFAGHRSDIAAVYRQIDILVLPSVNEGTPMTLIEALASERPVIASRVGDVPKLIRDRQTGLLVKPTDSEGLLIAIMRLLSDPAERRALAVQGRRHVWSEYSAQAMAREYAMLYRECAQKTTEDSPRGRKTNLHDFHT